ncbi:DUF3929 family protein, partial [Bacillus sp. D-CC]
GETIKDVKEFCYRDQGKVLERVANRVLFLDGGKLVEDSAPAEFFAAPKSERAQQFLQKIL